MIAVIIILVCLVWPSKEEKENVKQKLKLRKQDNAFLGFGGLQLKCANVAGIGVGFSSWEVLDLCTLANDL